MSNIDLASPSTAIASRTLLTGGFTITNSIRHPVHIEIHCQRPDLFGSLVCYLIVICDADEPPLNDISNIRKDAQQLGRTLVVVCKHGGATWISWRDFLDSLGGAVPSWRALGSNYVTILLDSAANKLPPNVSGEAWQIFEDAVSDGFEFVLGNRVNRLGGKKRGRRVSDMVVQTPDHHVLVIDAKASTASFNITWDELRPLIEYTKSQVTRQRGHFEVHGSILVAKEFLQKPDRLTSLSGDFLAESKVPLTFLRAQYLGDLVNNLGMEPMLRTSIKWTQVFCRGGLLEPRQITGELDSARAERYERGGRLAE